MKTKWFLLTLSAFFFGCVAILPALASEVYDNYGGIIYYEQDGVIIQNILAAGLKEEIGEGTLPSLSKNGKWLVYYDNDNYPVLYNTETEEKTVFEDLQSEPVSQPVWSPGNKYFTVESHTSTSEYESVVNKKGEVVASFMTVDEFAWKNKNVIFFTSMNDVEPPRPRGDGGGEGFGVSKLNVKNNTLTDLRMPSEFIDYTFDSIKNAKIVYTKYEVTDYEQWRELEDQTVTYWKMNKNGSHTFSLATLPETGEHLIAATLGDQYDEDKINDFGKYHNTSWHIFTLRDENSENPEIYIVHLDDASSLFKVDDGDAPTW
ncbi:MAG: hypothetical protein WC752_02000 [Patescibacteria group bacterium]|jgi:hypothetical protein